ncbi:Mediator of RNA polymerase II transcription subunit 30 [Nymphaea thermarum]|nr:Mediator of RNA polymerase II transcription subunit 30 [Nymphaea thermarum]
MEEKQGSSLSGGGGGGGGKSTKELAMEGQKLLEETVQAAHQILTAMNEELCNPALWATASPAQSGAELHDGPHQAEPGGGALEEARFRYKSTVTALRAVISAITNSQAAEQNEAGSMMGTSEAKSDPMEIKKLEERVAELKKEIAIKNRYLEILMDQLRELIGDISMWQSPCPV